MPELPEVETVARQLAPCLIGARLLTLTIVDQARLAEPTPPFDQHTVSAVARWGKLVVLTLDASATRYIAVHLRMTGRLKWFPLGSELETAHLRAAFIFDRGTLQFHDVRRFGTISFANDAAGLRPHGVDPTAPAFTADWLRGQLAASAQPIKAWLMRQDRLVGLGNIYCCEILFRAGVDPQRSCRTLGERQVTRIHDATVEILQRAIENCGTTFSDFQDSRGDVGNYGAYLEVYQREGEPCSTCTTPIRRVTHQQRSTFYCPRCQR